MKTIKILLIVATICILAVSCKKVSKVSIELSPETINAPSEAGAFTVSSNVTDLILDSINLLTKDGNWKPVNAEKLFSDKNNPSVCTGLEYDWVRIDAEPVKEKGMFLIEVSKNETLSPRACRVYVSAGDSIAYIQINQE